MFCEELSHPHLFLYGRFGFQIKRQILLSPTKYFNQRILNYIHKFSSDSEYIIFSHNLTKIANLYNQINMDKLTTCM